MLYTGDDKARLLGALPTRAEEAVTAAVVGASLDIPPMVAMGAMTALYLGGEVEKIFVGGSNSLYWKSEVCS